MGLGVMRDRPTGSELAMLAQGTGDEDPLAERCRAIAAREADAGDAAFASARAALEARYGKGEDGALLRRLAGDIAAGVFEAVGAERDWALDVLWAITRQKLNESNPAFLAVNDAH
jgi:hypothetical protein